LIHNKPEAPDPAIRGFRFVIMGLPFEVLIVFLAEDVHDLAVEGDRAADFA